LEHHRQFKSTFDRPLPLAITKAVSVVTCMDARLMPATMFGFHLGDAEYIRNAGGRVTDDVIRSLFVAQELLNTKVILLIHHTDCGAQAAVRHHDELLRKAKEKLGVDLSEYEMLGIGDSLEDLKNSVKEDVQKLIASPLMNRKIEIYGFVYDVKDASLTEIVRSVSRE